MDTRITPWIKDNSYTQRGIGMLLATSRALKPLSPEHINEHPTASLVMEIWCSGRQTFDHKEWRNRFTSLYDHTGTMHVIHENDTEVRRYKGKTAPAKAQLDLDSVDFNIFPQIITPDWFQLGTRCRTTHPPYHHYVVVRIEFVEKQIQLQDADVWTDEGVHTLTFEDIARLPPNHLLITG